MNILAKKNAVSGIFSKKLAICGAVAFVSFGCIKSEKCDGDLKDTPECSESSAVTTTPEDLEAPLLSSDIQKIDSPNQPIFTISIEASEQAVEMMISKMDDFSESSWEPFEGEYSVEFAHTAASCGENNAYVKLRDANLIESEVASIELTYQCWFKVNLNGAPSKRTDYAAVWSGSEMIVWGGMSDPDSNTLADGKFYNPESEVWTEMTATNAPGKRANASAVWSGEEMLIWGGAKIGAGYNDGGRYNPATDSWTPISTTNAPSARSGHSAVFGDGKMIIWGGVGSGGTMLNTGGIYDPDTDSWTTMTTVGAPSARRFIHRVSNVGVWAGSKYIIWGGAINSEKLVADGRVYDPDSDSWSPMSTFKAPSARRGHVTISTGEKMIVWGGYSGSKRIIASGAIYDPTTDTWEAMSVENAPQGRKNAFAHWTGSSMVVFGGNIAKRSFVFSPDGGVYNLENDSWTGIDSRSIDLTEKANARSVWTGTSMIVWGGCCDGQNYLNDGGIFVHPNP